MENKQAQENLLEEVKATVIDLCEGNPGAINVMMGIVQKVGIFEGKQLLDILKELDIRGSKIWLLFKDFCKQDLIDTMSVLMAYKNKLLTKEQIFFAINNQGQGVDLRDVLQKKC